jgi:hypothetical protein
MSFIVFIICYDLRLPLMFSICEARIFVAGPARHF